MQVHVTAFQQWFGKWWIVCHKGKLRRVTPLVLLLIHIKFLLNSTNGRLLYTSFELNFTNRIVFMKKRDDGGVLRESIGCIMVVWRKEGGWSDFNVSNLYKQSHMTLFTTFWLDPYLILRLFGSIKKRYYENHRGSNNCPNERTFYFAYYYIISDQNHMPWVFPNSKMLNYYIYYFQSIR